MPTSPRSNLLKVALFVLGVVVGLVAVPLFYVIAPGPIHVVNHSSDMSGYEAAQTKSIEMVDHQAQMMITYDAMLKKGLEDQERFGKILDTWEAEQKQYQTYLDSLQPKKQ